MTETKYDSILAGIHATLDKIIVQVNYEYRNLPAPSDCVDKLPSNRLDSSCLDSLNNVRVTLATHYNTLPYGAAVKCKERVELVEGLVQDYSERQRIEHLTRRWTLDARRDEKLAKKRRK